MKTITVFGSAKCPADSADYRLAYEIGKAIGAAGLNICNGGYGGTMEASAKGARAAGVSAFGITLRQFAFPANPYINHEIKAETYFDRLQLLFQRGDAYVVLKGGTGTLVELALAAEIMLKDFAPPKPLFVLEPFWRPLVEILRPEIDAPDPRFSGCGPSPTDKIFTPFSTAADFSNKLAELLNA